MLRKARRLPSDQFNLKNKDHVLLHTMIDLHERLISIEKCAAIVRSDLEKVYQLIREGKCSHSE